MPSDFDLSFQAVIDLDLSVKVEFDEAYELL